MVDVDSGTFPLTAVNLDVPFQVAIISQSTYPTNSLTFF